MFRFSKTIKQLQCCPPGSTKHCLPAPDPLTGCAALQQINSTCELKVSVQSPYGYAITLEVWNATFAQYLTEQLQGVLNCSFKLVILPTPDAAYGAVQNNQTDFLLVSAGLMQCIQVGV